MNDEAKSMSISFIMRIGSQIGVMLIILHENERYVKGFVNQSL